MTGNRKMSTTHYFAYGSNLLAKRMHLLNPNAVRVGKGFLKDHVIEFGGYASFWDGSPASIRKKVNRKVWGALWKLKNEDLCNLDFQEGVHEDFYIPITVEVENEDGTKHACRCYQQVEKFEEADLTNLPEKRKPSKAYMNTIITGAQETGLPADYISFLKTISTNDSEYTPDLERF